MQVCEVLQVCVVEGSETIEVIWSVAGARAGNVHSIGVHTPHVHILSQLQADHFGLNYGCWGTCKAGVSCLCMASWNKTTSSSLVTIIQMGSLVAQKL